MSTTCLALGGVARVEGGFLAAPVGLAFDDEFPGGGLQPVDGGLGEQRLGERGQPFVGRAVGGDDGGRLEVPFDRDLVEVGGLGGVVGLECEVIDDEDVDGDEPARARPRRRQLGETTGWRSWPTTSGLTVPARASWCVVRAVHVSDQEWSNLPSAPSTSSSCGGWSAGYANDTSGCTCTPWSGADSQVGRSAPEGSSCWDGKRPHRPGGQDLQTLDEHDQHHRPNGMRSVCPRVRPTTSADLVGRGLRAVAEHPFDNGGGHLGLRYRSCDQRASTRDEPWGAPSPVGAESLEGYRSNG
jgi:hypothetical protein